MVRAEDARHAKQRLREGMASLGEPMYPSLLEAWRRRVIPVCGDLARPGLGVSATDWAFLSENIHTIYHNGALVNYLLDYASMRAVNVVGTHDIVRLALSRRARFSSPSLVSWTSPIAEAMSLKRKL